MVSSPISPWILLIHQTHNSDCMFWHTNELLHDFYQSEVMYVLAYVVYLYTEYFRDTFLFAPNNGNGFLNLFKSVTPMEFVFSVLFFNGALGLSIFPNLRRTTTVIQYFVCHKTLTLVALSRHDNNPTCIWMLQRHHQCVPSLLWIQSDTIWQLQIQIFRHKNIRTVLFL